MKISVIAIVFYAATIVLRVDATSITSRKDLHSVFGNRNLQDCSAEETAALAECNDEVEVECGVCVANVAFDGCDEANNVSSFCDDIWSCTIPCGGDACLKKYIMFFDCALESMGEYKECVQEVCFKTTKTANGGGEVSGGPVTGFLATAAMVCSAFLLV